MGRVRQIAAATAAALIAAALLFFWWLVLLADPIDIDIGGRTLAIPAALLPLIGLALAGVVALLVRAWSPPSAAGLYFSSQQRSVATQLGPVLFLTIAASSVLLALAWGTGSIRPEVAALLLVFITATLLAASYALEALARGHAIEVTSHWGGLGGGLGGWRLSSPAVAILIGLAFLAATIGLMTLVERGEGEGKDGPSNTSTNGSANVANNSANVANNSATTPSLPNRASVPDVNSLAPATAPDAAAPPGRR